MSRIMSRILSHFSIDFSMVLLLRRIGTAIGGASKARNMSFSSTLYALPPTISQILSNPPQTGSEITINGHIKAIRKFRNIGFIDLSDGSCYKNLPIVVENPDILTLFKVGQSLAVVGNIIESQGTQDFEVSVDLNQQNHLLDVIGDVSDTYPIQKKAMTLSYLRNQPIFRHRTSTLSSILRVRSFLELKFMQFFESENFVKVTPPMITSADCEGAGEQFIVKPLNPKYSNVEGEIIEKEFFNKPVYLTVSTQLHLEVLAPSLNRVWTLTPCFRAEESNTNRHLSEFWMLEAEISYINKLTQLTKFTEKMIKYITKELAGNDDIIKSRFDKKEQNIMQERWNNILEKEWPIITYSEAIDILNKVKAKGRLKGRVNWGDSILTENEKWLAGEHFQSPVFITDYPKSQKPFYMPNSSENTVACFDLIFPGIGELIGGSMREHRYEQLVKEMENRGMNIKDMEWYLSTRQNGTIPHGGFGMGFERLIVYLTALDNLKDVVTFPRAPEICDC